MKPNIVPLLLYKEMHVAVDWLVRAFDFKRQTGVSGDAAVPYAELRFGAGVIALRSAPAGSDLWAGVRQGTYVCVEDIDQHCRNARNAGTEIAGPLHDTTWGSREYTARDLDGHLWTFGTHDMGAGAGEVTFVPELRYRSITAATEWLKTAFGFETAFQVPGPDGSIFHAEVRFGDGTVYIGQMSEHQDEWSDVRQFTNVVIGDPDRHHDHAKAAGAHIVVPPRNTPFGARFYAARDPELFLWWLSTYKPAAPGTTPSHL